MVHTLRVLFSGGNGSRNAVDFSLNTGSPVQLISFVPAIPSRIKAFQANLTQTYGSASGTWNELNDGSGGMSRQLSEQLSSVIFPVAIDGVLDEDMEDLLCVWDSAGATALFKGKVSAGLIRVSPGDSVVVGVTQDHFLRDRFMDGRMVAFSRFLSEYAGGQVKLVFPNRNLRKEREDGSVVMWMACAPDCANEQVAV